MTMVTSKKTKSGTIIYVHGGGKQERISALENFLKYFNRNFTISEQKTIGNVWYDLTTGASKNSKGKIIAETGTFTGPDVKIFNPNKKKMVDLYVAKDGRKSEYTITHEMIHAKKFMNGISGDKHNEKKIDFEAVARVSKNALHNKNMHGYYFDPSGNKALSKKKLSNSEKGKIAQAGVMEDRKLLTGSVNKSIVGKTAETRVKKLYPKSFFNKKV
jgi:hypothetical protein